MSDLFGNSEGRVPHDEAHIICFRFQSRCDSDRVTETRRS